jgi:hypothetical protein
MRRFDLLDEFASAYVPPRPTTTPRRPATPRRARRAAFLFTLAGLAVVLALL